MVMLQGQHNEHIFIGTLELDLLSAILHRARETFVFTRRGGYIAPMGLWLQMEHSPHQTSASRRTSWTPMMPNVWKLCVSSNPKSINIKTKSTEDKNLCGASSPKRSGRHSHMPLS